MDVASYWRKWDFENWDWISPGELCLLVIIRSRRNSKTYKLCDHPLIIFINVLPRLVHNIDSFNTIKLLSYVSDEVRPSVLNHFRSMRVPAYTWHKGEGLVSVVLILLGNMRPSVLNITRSISVDGRRRTGEVLPVIVSCKSAPS